MYSWAKVTCEVLERRSCPGNSKGRSRCRGPGSRAGGAGSRCSSVDLAAVGRGVAEELAADLGEVDVGLAAPPPLRPSRARVAPAELPVLDLVDVFGDRSAPARRSRGRRRRRRRRGRELGRVDALGDPVDAEVARCRRRARRLRDRVGVAVGVGSSVGRPARSAAARRERLLARRGELAPRRPRAGGSGGHRRAAAPAPPRNRPAGDGGPASAALYRQLGPSSQPRRRYFSRDRPEAPCA